MRRRNRKRDTRITDSLSYPPKNNHARFARTMECTMGEEKRSYSAERGNWLGGVRIVTMQHQRALPSTSFGHTIRGALLDGVQGPTTGGHLQSR